jgi:hypothetical protein
MSEPTFDIDIASPNDVADLAARWADKRARTYPVQVAYVHTARRGELSGMQIPLSLGFVSIDAANAWIADARANAENAEIRFAKNLP